MNVKRKFFFIMALMAFCLPSFQAIDNGISAQTSQQKSGTITGIVKDSKGEPVIGASVRVKGSSIGTITDVNGNFNLSSIHPNATLVVSYIGMTSQEIALDNKKTINVTLQESAVGMNEVVVVG
ncbi:MAG: carboxypeptidase-like regulatory domain-containing protein, partial [Bacteroidota bacterium]|nr:carboxypeptidase-like regulatory domain-containing protein [Bacteroidota bacterium]